MTTTPAVSQLRIAVAASAGELVERMAGRYQELTGVEIEMITGSSGAFAGQILQGAPYDLFFSADTTYPAQLERAGMTSSPLRVYAVGSLALVCRVPPDSSSPLKTLIRNSIRRVAVANPQLAPYGKTAIDALSLAGILDEVRPKLIYAESVTHVNHFMATGVVDAALTALAPARAGFPDMYILELETPGIPQGAVLLKRQPGRSGTGASEFLEYVLSQAGRQMIEEYGYRLP